MRGPIKDLTGQRFGRLVVLGDSEKRRWGQVLWKCRCDCGKEILKPAGHLAAGEINSCGCLSRETAHNQQIKKLDKNGAMPEKIIKYKNNSNNTSDYKGVSLKNNIYWTAQICYARKQYHLLCSHNINDCIAVRQEAEQAVKDGNFLEWIAAYKGHK